MIKELNIFGDIVSEGWCDEDVTPSGIKASVEGLTAADELRVNINCYGGEVFAAVAIASIIEKTPAKKVFNVIGICASAATMLFTETDIVNIARGAMLMYHKPIIGIHGNENDLRRKIEILDKIENENILKGLAFRTKKPVDELASLIANEWWLTSEEAIQNLGFVASGSVAIENKAKTKMTDIYNNYIEKKKALNVDAFKQFINFKNKVRQ
jgi:ATP-dependent protease ClpP protease subunit